MFVARRGVFLENDFLLKRASGSSIDIQEVHESTDAEPEVEPDDQQVVDET